MKVVIVGSKGMLGSALERAVKSLPYELTVQLIDEDVRWLDRIWFRPDPQGTLVFNCVGITPSSWRYNDKAQTIHVNSLFPHQLANYCQAIGAKLIHISTNCVFRGVHVRTGSAPPSSFHHCVAELPNAVDFYGQTKAMGEPSNAIVVRTSFVGAKSGLGKWALEYEGKLPGWTDVYWSGWVVEVLALELARVFTRPFFDETAPHDWRPCIIHAPGSEVMSKAELLRSLIKNLVPEGRRWEVEDTIGGVASKILREDETSSWGIGRMPWERQWLSRKWLLEEDNGAASF